jgi:trk system potassium uptake protein
MVEEDILAMDADGDIDGMCGELHQRDGERLSTSTSTGTDETNLVVTSLARFAFHVPRTMARVHTPQNA